MNELFNFHDFWYVVSHYIWWWILAFALGILVGWWTCDTSSKSRGN